MIEAVKIEDFVIEQLFMPYTPSLCPSDFVKPIKRKLRRNPEYIIQLLNENLDVKERAFKRLKMFGGVKWYRYLDMNIPVIRWVNENLEEI
ncbi:hypothetical protein B5F53_11635 [Blautia sp. An249]|nr:hypothetical protein B5F53_11635 [Blautia sp. An249]